MFSLPTLTMRFLVRREGSVGVILLTSLESWTSFLMSMVWRSGSSGVSLVGKVALGRSGVEGFDAGLDCSFTVGKFGLAELDCL